MRGSPPSTRESLAVVPPMSKARRFPPLSSRPKKAAAMAPAAGPDSSICTGVRCASPTWVSPPLESMRIHRAGIERAPDAAVGLDTLGHLEAQVARHERLGLGDGEVVELVLPLAPDLERVGEALVVMSPVGAPLRSIRALVKSVVACTTRV